VFQRAPEASVQLFSNVALPCAHDYDAPAAAVATTDPIGIT
jgi:hypothetical protein